MNRVSLSVIIGVPDELPVPLSWIVTAMPTTVGSMFETCPDIATIYQQYGYLYSKEIRRLAQLRGIDLSQISIPMKSLQEAVDAIFNLVKWLKVPAHIGTRGIQYFFSFIRLAMPRLQDSSDGLMRGWLRYLLERDLMLLASVSFVIACKFELGIGVNQEVLQQICQRQPTDIPASLRQFVIPEAFLATYPDIQPQDIGVRTPWQSYWIYQAVECIFLKVLNWDISQSTAHEFAQYFLLNGIHMWQPYEQQYVDDADEYNMDGLEENSQFLESQASNIFSTSQNISQVDSPSIDQTSLSTIEEDATLNSTVDSTGFNSSQISQSHRLSHTHTLIPRVSSLPIIPFTCEQQIVSVCHLTHCFIAAASTCPTFILSFEDQALVACAALRCAVTMLKFDDAHWKHPILRPMCVLKQRDENGEIIPDELSRTEYIGDLRLKKIDQLSKRIMEFYIKRRRDYDECGIPDPVFPSAAVWTWPFQEMYN